MPVVTRLTDATGRATLPKTEGLEREKTPVAWVVEKAGDLSFMPVDRREHLIGPPPLTEHRTVEEHHLLVRWHPRQHDDRGMDDLDPNHIGERPVVN